jgi:hypothetical protein
MPKPKKPSKDVPQGSPNTPLWLRSDLFFGPDGIRQLSGPSPVAPEAPANSVARQRAKPLSGKKRRLRVRTPGQDYTPTELALEWGLSTDKIRELFRNEPGVKKIRDEKAGRKGKRRYTTLRIPEAVAQRVAQRLS